MQLNQTETSMSTQTQELINLYEKKLITKDNAIKNSNRPEEIVKILENM